MYSAWRAVSGFWLCTGKRHVYLVGKWFPVMYREGGMSLFCVGIGPYVSRRDGSMAFLISSFVLVFLFEQERASCFCVSRHEGRQYPGMWKTSEPCLCKRENNRNKNGKRKRKRSLLLPRLKRPVRLLALLPSCRREYRYHAPQ